MQEAQHINDVLPLKTTDQKHDEVSDLTPLSGNVKRTDIGAIACEPRNCLSFTLTPHGIYSAINRCRCAQFTHQSQN